MTGSVHEPVLVNEVIDALQINAAGCYLDGTFGRGGHAKAILGGLSEFGRLIAIDRDHEAIEHANRVFNNEKRLTAVKSNFANLDEILRCELNNEKLDGAFFDLGVSSPQLDQAERGFSFRHSGPLDMRMDQQSDQTAASWLAHAEEHEMRRVFKHYGEERYAGRIARQIVAYRQEQLLTTTGQLADLIAQTVPTKEREKHPATRVFQAIRIHINQELTELERMLSVVLQWLKPGARLAIISFHSLEDRIVKRFLRQASIGDDYPQDLAITHDMLNPSVKLIGKPVRANDSEIRHNPRSRSAILRIAQKLEQKS